MQSSRQRRLVPFWVLVTFVGISALAIVLLALYFHREHLSETARLRRQMEAVENKQKQVEIDRQKAATADTLTLARTRQQEVILHARHATNQIELLRAEIGRLTNQAATVKVGEAGRFIALHPDLTAQARRFYESDLPGLPSAAEIINKLEGARRVEQTVLAGEGTANMPGPELAVTAQNAGVWGEQIRQRVGQLQTILDTLVQESKIKVAAAPLNSTSPSLEAAMSELTRGELTFRQQTIVTNTAVAQQVAATTVAEAAGSSIIEKAKLEAAAVLQKAKDEAEQMRRESERKAAEAKVLDSQTKVAVLQKEDEAKKIQLRQKASEPAIKTKLAPFTTPGYLSSTAKLTVDKQPHSFSILKNWGALEPTMTGLQKLAEVGYSPLDKVRPRWRFKRSGPAGWRNNPDETEMIKEVQRLLVELGPVLVEMGELSP